MRCSRNVLVRGRKRDKFNVSSSAKNGPAVVVTNNTEWQERQQQQ